jgi:hypothetical protein
MCDTAAMSFPHESFWLATATAAPVIALAAIVALPDTSVIAQKFIDLRLKMDPRPTPYQERLLKAAQVVVLLPKWTTMVNLIVQAALLAVSLWALAYEHDVIPPGVATVQAVGGILLLAWSASTATTFNRMLERRIPVIVRSPENKESPS